MYVAAHNKIKTNQSVASETRITNRLTALNATTHTSPYGATHPPLAFSAVSGSAAGTDRVPVGQRASHWRSAVFLLRAHCRGTLRLVYAHGFGQTRGAWNRTGLAMAAHGYAGLAYDARGHGESDRNAAGLPYTGDQFADDLIVMAGEQPNRRCWSAPRWAGCSA